MVLFTLLPSELLGGEVVFAVPTSLSSVGLELLVSSGDEVLPPEDRLLVCLVLKMQLSSGILSALCLRKRRHRKETQ